eukprot:1211455-Pleurochrysis_carterae.AAC.1
MKQHVCGNLHGATNCSAERQPNCITPFVQACKPARVHEQGWSEEERGGWSDRGMEKWSDKVIEGLRNGRMREERDG